MSDRLVDPIQRVRCDPGVVRTVDPQLKEWVAEHGWVCTVWEDPPGSYHSPHDHPYSHRVLVESGQIVFTVGTEQYPLRTGDALDLPARVEHAAQVDDDRPCRYWLLRPSPDR